MEPSDELKDVLRWRRRVGEQMEMCYEIKAGIESIEMGDYIHKHKQADVSQWVADMECATNRLLGSLREWKIECEHRIVELCEHRIVEDWVDALAWDGHMKKIKYCEICETTFDT